jgi:hypothetical protein
VEIYSRRERQQEDSAHIGGWAAFLAIVIIAMVLLTGCTGYTIVKLTAMCHAAEKSPASSFNGESGKVDCR